MIMKTSGNILQLLLLACLLKCFRGQNPPAITGNQAGQLPGVTMEQMMAYMKSLLNSMNPPKTAEVATTTVPGTTLSPAAAFSALPYAEQVRIMRLMTNQSQAQSSPQQTLTFPGQGPPQPTFSMPLPSPQVSFTQSFMDPFSLMAAAFGGSMMGSLGGGNPMVSPTGFATLGSMSLESPLALNQRMRFDLTPTAKGDNSTNNQLKPLLAEFNRFIVQFRPYLSRLGDSLAETMGDVSMPCPLFYDPDPAVSVTMMMPAMQMNNVRQCLNPISCNLYDSIRAMTCMQNPINCQIISKLMEFCERFHTPSKTAPQTTPPTSLPIVRTSLPEVNPQPEMISAVRPEATPVVGLEFRPEVPPEVPPEVRPEVIPMVRPEVIPVVRPEVIPMVRPDDIPVVRPEVTPVVRPEVTPVVRPEVRPSVKAAVRPTGHHRSRFLRPSARPTAPRQSVRPTVPMPRDPKTKLLNLLSAILKTKTTTTPPPPRVCDICVSASMTCSPPLMSDPEGLCAGSRHCCIVMAKR